MAVRQIEDDVRADDVDQEELAAILRELIEDTDLPGGSNQPIRPGSANPRRPAPSRPGPTGRTSARTATSRSRAEAPAWPGRQINIL
ncbi:hypothetical protein ACFTZJ_22035 [Streptomyces globisporus]|uniref:hypothetical protein n=1 Tax=Streptomyces globisporus TaxID=1908 RepID=UPI00363FB032